MIDILEWLHPYVPGHDKEIDSKPIKVLSGGDYLTFERHKEAQSSVQDARTPSARLEGLIPKLEDFHSQAEWLKVQHIISQTEKILSTITLPIKDFCLINCILTFYQVIWHHLYDLGSCRNKGTL